MRTESSLARSAARARGARLPVATLRLAAHHSATCTHGRDEPDQAQGGLQAAPQCDDLRVRAAAAHGSRGPDARRSGAVGGRDRLPRGLRLSRQLQLRVQALLRAPAPRLEARVGRATLAGRASTPPRGRLNAMAFPIDHVFTVTTDREAARTALAGMGFE